MFNNPSQTSKPGNRELKLEKKGLEEEIGAMGVQHEKTAKDLKEIESRKLKSKDNKTLCTRLEKKKIELESTLIGLEIKIKEAGKKLFGLEGQHSQKVAALNLEFSEKREEIKNESDKTMTEFDIASKEFNVLKNRIDEIEKEKNTLVEKIKELKSEAEILEGSSVKLKKINKELPGKEKQEKELESSIANLQASEISLGNKIKQLHKEMGTISNRVAEAKAGAEKFINESKGIKEKFDNEMKIQREKADKRDGLISEREDWLEDKTKKLRGAKTALEKHYNRKLNHIII